MAPKRAASKSAGAAIRKQAKIVEKSCSVIASSIKTAESIPQPVRSILSTKLVQIFGTYKEDRHEFQTTCSALVGKTLKATEAGLQAAIKEAEGSKAGADQEGAAREAANNAALAASEAAAGEATTQRDALASCQKELKDAKQAQHDAETAVKTLEEDTRKTAAKKDSLQTLNKEFFSVVRDGTLAKGLSKSASWAGKKLGADFADSLEKEFLVCVVRTFSKAAATWDTFDGIINSELDSKLQKIEANLESEIQALAGKKDPTAANVETCKAAVAAAEERVKAAEEVVTNATNAAKDAKTAAKAATASLGEQKKVIGKAESVLEDAKSALSTFQAGALAAFAEAEANTAPPPPPEPEVPAEAAPLDEVMTAAPEAAKQTSPGILPSPRVLLTRAASGVASAVSSRLAPSPRVQSSPGRQGSQTIA